MLSSYVAARSRCGWNLSGQDCEELDCAESDRVESGGGEPDCMELDCTEPGCAKSSAPLTRPANSVAANSRNIPVTTVTEHRGHVILFMYLTFRWLGRPSVEFTVIIWGRQARIAHAIFEQTVQDWLFPSYLSAL